MIWVVLPAFNEEDSLSRLLPKINTIFSGKGYGYRVVVVNDGSVDRTSGILSEFSKRLPIDVVYHPINRGLGETERDGFEYVASKCANDDIAIRIDCDDTHEPKYFPDLIEKMKEGCDVVIASRFQPGGGQIGVNAYRSFVSYCANVFMKLFFNIRGVKDYSCGFRAYRGEALKYAVRIFGNGFIQLKGVGFTSTLETIVKFKMMGCKFAEVPFVLRYDQKMSTSKMVSSITMLGYMIMTVLYHWPFGGWRVAYKDLNSIYKRSKEGAVKKYADRARKKSMACRLGSG